MKTVPTLLAALAATLLHAPSLVAQEDVLRPKLPPWFFYGIEPGVNYNFYATDMTKDYPVPDSPHEAWESGSALSPYVSLFADVVLSKDAGLVVRASFDQKRFANEKTGPAQVLVWNSETDKSALDVDYKLEYDVIINYVGLSLAGRMNITPDIFVTLGPVFNFRIDSTLQEERHEILTEEARAVFFDANKNPIGKAQYYSEHIQSEPSFRWGIEFRGGFRVPIANDIHLVPFLGFQYWVTELIEDRTSGDPYQMYSHNPEVPAKVTITNSMLHSLQLGLAVHFSLR